MQQVRAMVWQGKNCASCGVVLTEDNVVPWRAKHRYYICRDCQRIAGREKKRRLRQRVLSALGGKCVKCGFEDWRALQIDHINGEGYKERTRGRHDQKRYYEILNMSEEERKGKYQCLCANCNWIKVHENKENRANARYGR